MKKIFTISLLTAVILFTSCSVSFEKRRYRPGYHIEVSKNRPHEKFRQIRTEEKIVPVKMYYADVPSHLIPAVNNQPENLIENTPTVFKPVNQVKIQDKKHDELDSCDVIFTAVGERIQAKIIEIGDEYVHYKRCDDPKGRLYSIKTKMIDNITLRNGELIVPKNRVIVDKEKERKKSGVLFGLTISSVSLGIIAFIFSFFIPPFAGLSFAFSILNAFYSFILLLINIRPSRFVPSYRTKLTWIFCLVALLLFIASMIIVLA